MAKSKRDGETPWNFEDEEFLPPEEWRVTPQTVNGVPTGIYFVGATLKDGWRCWHRVEPAIEPRAAECNG